MAKNNSIIVNDKWVDLGELALPPGTAASAVEKLLLVKPIRVSLEVILPKDASAKDFDYNKNAEIKKFRMGLESKAAKTFAAIVDEDQPQEGKKALEELNSYLEKAVKAFRVVLRTAVAKELEGNYKADDLMTAGSIQFEKIEFLFGVGNSSEEKFPLLDLTKAFKRLKKDQQFGAAWKANKIVVSVRLRKPFKEAELKELRELLPEGSSRGAAMLAGEFTASAKGKVEIRFAEKAAKPHEILLRKAFKKQTGQAVHITVANSNPKAEGGDEKIVDGKKKKKKKSAET